LCLMAVQSHPATKPAPTPKQALVYKVSCKQRTCRTRNEQIEGSTSAQSVRIRPMLAKLIRTSRRTDSGGMTPYTALLGALMIRWMASKHTKSRRLRTSSSSLVVPGVQLCRRTTSDRGTRRSRIDRGAHELNDGVSGH